MLSNITTSTSIESQFDSALDLIRHLRPQQVEKNLSNINDLVLDLTEEFLLDIVNQPLKVLRDRIVGKDYLLCDYNRNGDSYRSPWTNTYTPPSNGNLPSDSLRQLEIEANQMFEQYDKMPFDSGVSSVYFWNLENGFAGVILIKKFYHGSSTSEGCRDSIHVVVVEEKQNDHSAHYKLTSTVMLWLNTDKTMSGMMNLTGKLIQQLESDHQIADFSQHLINIGTIVEQMENKIHQTLNSSYSGKTKDILNSLYNSGNIDESSNVTNKSNYLNNILMEGKNMSDVDFKNFIKNQAPNFYWEILAERARIKLVDQLRENQQLHELLDELINERGQLEEKKQQYENFKNIIESTNGINSLLLFKMLQLVQQKQQLTQEKQQWLQEKQQWLQEKHELLQIIKKK
ncbi:unnamed protein product [Rotaria socialis]|uniref:F-actin-capping protein subunit beta n=1 Tax=Rotaria socialis TaxID=392032 RepID=A0A818Y1R5_9BILA|nr:unnamed protein product [Rotaria socialis]CAF4820406.1 unnamed protein product [Rotaria socialis]